MTKAEAIIYLVLLTLYAGTGVWAVCDYLCVKVNKWRDRQIVKLKEKSSACAESKDGDI